MSAAQTLSVRARCLRCYGEQISFLVIDDISPLRLLLRKEYHERTEGERVD